MKEIKFRFVDKDDIVYDPMRLIDLVEQAKSCAKDSLASFISSKNSGCLTLNEFIRGMNKGEIKVEQYTGQNDKNGVEIYEGDILKTSPEISMDGIGYVSFMNGEFLVVDGEYDEGKHVVEFYDYNKPEEDFEVIGNVHQTPELLKGKGGNENE